MLPDPEDLASLRMIRSSYYALLAIVLGQAAFGLWGLGRARWNAEGPGIVTCLTASGEDRIRRAFGDDAAILDLIAAHVPDDGLVFVDAPMTEALR